MQPAPVLLLFFVNGLVEAEELSKSEKIEMRLINGDEGDYGQFPYTALLGGYRSLGIIRYCGGALLSAQWIVTCAKCLDQVIRFDIHLGAKEFRQVAEPGRELYESKTFFAHPKYQRGAYDCDIGLIQLPLIISLNRHIQPVQLPPIADFTGQIAIATGWGASTTTDLSLSRILHYAEFQVLTREKCNYKGNLPDSIFCARATRNQNICSGDGGGPLVLPDRNVLIGIISFTTNCENGVGGFVKVSSYLDWIHSQTGIPILNVGSSMSDDISSYGPNMNNSRNSAFYASQGSSQPYKQPHAAPLQTSSSWSSFHNSHLNCGRNKLGCTLHQSGNPNGNCQQNSNSVPVNTVLGMEKPNIYAQNNQMDRSQVTRPFLGYADTSAGQSNSYVLGSIESGGSQNGVAGKQSEFTNAGGNLGQTNFYGQSSVENTRLVSGGQGQQNQYGNTMANQGSDSHSYPLMHTDCRMSHCVHSSKQVPGFAQIGTVNGYHQNESSIKKSLQQKIVPPLATRKKRPQSQSPKKKLTKHIYSNMQGPNQHAGVPQYGNLPNQAPNSVNVLIAKAVYGSHQPQMPQIQIPPMPAMSMHTMQGPQGMTPHMPHFQIPKPPTNIVVQTHESFEKYSKQKISSITSS